jgi:hypothetical protein
LPEKLLPTETARRYCTGESVSAREKSDRLIFTFLLNEESGGEWVEGQGNLSALLQIRNELAHGDLRALYLGWLMGVESGEVEKEQVEPPLPPNLGDLSGPQASFADFFHLDPDLLSVAAQNSARTGAKHPDPKELSSWIASLPVQEKNEMLVRLMAGEAAKIGMELQSRFHRQRENDHPSERPKPRTAAELLAAAEKQRENRAQGEARKAALEKERQERLAAIAREKHLDSLSGRSETIWTTVETLTATRLPKSYDLAVKHLIDLRDLAERESHQADFKKGIVRFRNEQSAKKSLIDRLVKAGL